MIPARLLVVALMGLTAGFVTPALRASAKAGGEMTIDTSDGPRHALVIPAGNGARPTVIVLHGALGTGAGTARTTGFAEAAAKRGFTAVFPDGLGRQWNDGRAGGPGGPDDIGFIRALVKRLVAEGDADPQRIYLAGISNGGSVGLGGGRGEVWSVERTANLFARLDRCGGQIERPLPDRDPSDGTSVTRVAWDGCSAGTSVTLYRVEGGGHSLPGRPSLAPRLLGLTNFDISGPGVILDAFTQSSGRML